MTSDLLMLGAVLVLVLANGFFVAAEFALVGVRRSRVDELVHAGRRGARTLQRATGALDTYLAATQLGITISSLALGWIGEPALAHLVEPLLDGIPGAGELSHAIGGTIAFVAITALHIVLGELAPKSLALQRSEATALAVVRPLQGFLLVFRPAIWVLNALGTGVLRLVGLKPSPEHESVHSPDELRLIVAQSRQAGLIEHAQQRVVERAFSVQGLSAADILTPRRAVAWIDASATPEALRAAIRAIRHERVLVGRGSVEEFVGVVTKQDLLDQALDGGAVDPLAAMRPVATLPGTLPVLAALDRFRQDGIRLAAVVDEYGTLLGVLTQTDLLEAFAGEIPDPGEAPDFLAQADGSLLIEGGTPVGEAFDALGLRAPDGEGDYATLAGFALHRLGIIPEAGARFSHAGRTFEVAEMDGRRIAQVRVLPVEEVGAA